jgi:hypothetical protein
MSLLRFVVFLGFLLAGDEGVGVDPFGIRMTSGSCMDPEGRPRCTQRAFEGNGFDPHGKPGRTTSNEGSGLDPHGKP